MSHVVLITGFEGRCRWPADRKVEFLGNPLSQVATLPMWRDPLSRAHKPVGSSPAVVTDPECSPEPAPIVGEFASGARV